MQNYKWDYMKLYISCYMNYSITCQSLSYNKILFYNSHVELGFYNNQTHTSAFIRHKHNIVIDEYTHRCINLYE